MLVLLLCRCIVFIVVMFWVVNRFWVFSMCSVNGEL